MERSRQRSIRMKRITIAIFWSERFENEFATAVSISVSIWNLMPCTIRKKKIQLPQFICKNKLPICLHLFTFVCICLHLFAFVGSMEYVSTSFEYKLYKQNSAYENNKFPNSSSHCIFWHFSSSHYSIFFNSTSTKFSNFFHQTCSVNSGIWM